LDIVVLIYNGINIIFPAWFTSRNGLDMSSKVDGMVVHLTKTLNENEYL
jgi:hypothetical protein